MDEANFVYREESFNDLAVQELAKGRSACLCRLQFGRCKKEECAKCRYNIQFENCLNQMSDYDKQRLMTYTGMYYGEDSAYPTNWMSFSRIIIHYIKYVINCCIG